MTYVIAVYERGLSYGGPEEGGWWYDTGELRSIVRTASSEEKAYAISRRVNNWLRRLQKHRRPVSSCAYDGGVLSAGVYERIAPDYYPQERPYYE